MPHIMNSKRKKLQLLAIGTILFVLVGIGSKKPLTMILIARNINSSQEKSWCLQCVTMAEEKVKLNSIERRLTVARKKLIKAYRLARSAETRKLIRDSLHLLELELKIDKTEDTQLTNEAQNSTERKEVCDEYWGDPQEGHVDFEHVYRTIPCDRIPITHLVEILIYAESCMQGEHLVHRIRAVYPDISIQMAVTPQESEVCEVLNGVQIHYGLKDAASTWIRLSDFQSTKYILVGRNMVEFTHYADLDRMLRVMNSLQVDVVGGAVRLEPEGRWYAGCYQTNVRNFTIRIQPGHDLSSQSCAYCDYLASPFLIQRTLFKRTMNESKMEGMMSFVDMFLRLAHSHNRDAYHSVACIDVLFHVAGHQSSRGHGVVEIPKPLWVPIASQWKIDRIMLAGVVEHTWSCEEVNIQCSEFVVAGVIAPRCCLEDLAYCVKAFLNLTAVYNVSAFTAEGTNVGAVKIYGGILPWERDADIYWDVYKHDLVRGPIANDLAQKFNLKLGPIIYNTEYGDDIEKCAANYRKHCLAYSVRCNFWHVEVYGLPWIIADNTYGLENPTQIALNGLWTMAMPNPGRAARQRYGDNVLSHIEHWWTYNLQTSWTHHPMRISMLKVRTGQKQFMISITVGVALRCVCNKH
ncbi:hypothetical protein CSKR_110078 [Clonorchis sinensis]|uniref:Uncharacterized protein n=1 Tax=Clonorchis sinensis TaxID=79923 RepID=A0A419QEB2_CLOSI|nr:hypothetical protein CSKR_110078 [Clonorchis sinensis]